MSRFLLLAALALLASAASAQPVYDGPYYNGLDEPAAESARPGVRVGVGVGPYVYSGPYFDASGVQRSDDALATNLAVTGEVLLPLAGRLSGRVVGGLANIGADDDPSGDGIDDTATNPFYTSQTVLAEAHLLYYVASPRAAGVAPYVFTGLSGLFATGGAASGVPTTALAVPVGVGVEYGLSRTISLYAEGSYRFGLTGISPGGGVGGVRALAGAVDVCDAASPSYNLRACKEKGGEPSCSNGGALPDCREVSDGGEVIEDRDRFNAGQIGIGLRMGFGGAPAPAPRVPEYVAPPAVEPAPPVVASASPAVCDLVELNSVYFDYGAGTLGRRARSLLDENVELLLSNPECCVFVDGYTDTAEGDRFGLGLAGRRAQVVHDYYLSRGVEARRLQIRSRGAAVPACDKEDPGPGCVRNRRVESLPVDCERFRFLLENPSYGPY